FSAGLEALAQILGLYQPLGDGFLIRARTQGKPDFACLDYGIAGAGVAGTCGPNLGRDSRPVIAADQVTPCELGPDNLLDGLAVDAICFELLEKPFKIRLAVRPLGAGRASLCNLRVAAVDVIPLRLLQLRPAFDVSVACGLARASARLCKNLVLRFFDQLLLDPFRGCLGVPPRAGVRREHQPLVT